MITIEMNNTTNLSSDPDCDIAVISYVGPVETFQVLGEHGYFHLQR